MSAPITIPVLPSRSSFSAASSLSSSASSGGLYVPVHKRTGSGSTSSRSSSSTRSSSFGSEHSTQSSSQPRFVYPRDALLNLANSPLARISAEMRESLRSDFPQLVTNRKQRKAIEYHTHIAQTATKIQPVPSHRTRPTGRTSDRKKNTSKVMEEVSWRGRNPAVVPIAV